MAELTTLEEKLAEVTGLAKAAQEATQKVEGLVDDEELQGQLQRMRAEAEETERRCTKLAEGRDGKKTAILEKAQETKNEAAEMMSTYLGSDADDLDGFEFLTMAEAGEVGHWEILGKLSEKAGEPEVGELVEWALPIQERHLKDVREGSLSLAAEEDPNA
jgi:TolA-binding protein